MKMAVLKFLRQKKLIICFSGTARVTFNPPAPKNFIEFPVFTLKNRLYMAHFLNKVPNNILLIFGGLRKSI